PYSSFSMNRRRSTLQIDEAVLASRDVRARHGDARKAPVGERATVDILAALYRGSGHCARVFSIFVALVFTGFAFAQDASWPDRPIRMVVPFSAGGSSDVIARIVGGKITEALGQPVVVDARPGAGTSIGNAVVARATPDGYTLLLADVAF